MCWFLIDFWVDRVYYKTVAYVTGLIYPMRQNAYYKGIVEVYGISCAREHVLTDEA